MGNLVWLNLYWLFETLSWPCIKEIFGVVVAVVVVFVAALVVMVQEHPLGLLVLSSLVRVVHAFLVFVSSSCASLPFRLV